MVAALRLAASLAQGEAAYLVGITGLLLVDEGAGTRLYALSRAAAGGVGAWSVDAEGGVAFLNQTALAGTGALGAAGLALAGGRFLLAAGASTAGLGILADGSLARAFALTDSAVAVRLGAVASLDLGGSTVVWGLEPGSPLPTAWVMTPAATTAALGAGARPAVAQAMAAVPEPAPDLLAAAGFGGTAVLVTASSVSGRLTSLVAGPGGAVQAAQVIEASAGIGIAAPSALEVVQTAAGTLLLVAGAGSSSLTVFALAATGAMTPLFHAIDTLATRFAQVAALETVTVAGRTYVLAGGGDQGMSLFLLLDDGRLVHLHALAWPAAGIAPGNLTALAARAATAADGMVRLDIFAAGQTAGLALLSADLGLLTPPQRAGAGAATLTGRWHNDLLIGGDGPVTLAGGQGNDILVGGAGAAHMTGGGGSDLFVMAANGRVNVIADFNPNLDRIDLSAFPMLRDFAQLGFQQLALGARLSWQGTVIEVLSTRPLRPADFGPDPLGGLAAYPLAVRDQELAGTAGADLLTGGGGNDLLTGGAGDDTLEGGAGNDTIWAGAGNDLIYGGDGDDLMAGGVGNDTFYGGAGNDTVWSGATGDDFVWMESGDNEVWTGGGNDTIHGGTGNDVLGGDAGDDVIHAGGGRNRIWAGPGADTVWGGDGGDSIGGGADNDVIHAGAGQDTLMGGVGAGADTLYGNGGADLLYGGDGADVLYGGDGADTLVADGGFDLLYGGLGADRFEFWRNFGWNRVEDFSLAEGDVIALGRGMLNGATTGAQVLASFGRINPAGDAVIDLAHAGTTVVIVGQGSLASLADSIVIL